MGALLGGSFLRLTPGILLMLLLAHGVTQSSAEETAAATAPENPSGSAAKERIGGFPSKCFDLIKQQGLTQGFPGSQGQGGFPGSQGQGGFPGSQGQGGFPGSQGQGGFPEGPPGGFPQGPGGGFSQGPGGGFSQGPGGYPSQWFRNLGRQINNDELVQIFNKICQQNPNLSLDELRKQGMKQYNQNHPSSEAVNTFTTGVIVAMVFGVLVAVGRWSLSLSLSV